LNLAAFLKRIGYVGSPQRDIATLKAIHRAFALSVPYEALDLQVGKPMAVDVQGAYDKIVGAGRGGWCYEANGLLAWAYEAIGFDVKRLCGGVMRATLGDRALGNHLVLLVDCDGQTFVADVGFGDGLIEPVLLRAGRFSNGIYQCALEDMGGQWWRYHNDPRGASPSFDFQIDLTDAVLLEKSASWLATHETSPFVLNAIAQMWTQDSQKTLRGRVFSVVTLGDISKEIVSTEERYHAILHKHFGIDIAAKQGLWERVCARHEALGLSV
jgi:N-hydroxyarylamine O-acetyltransferase